MQLNKHQTNYLECRSRLENDLKTTASLCSHISFWRGISFVAAGILFCLSYQNKSLIYALLASAVFIFFLFLIRYHERLKQKQEEVMNHLSVVNDYLARFSDDWKNFTIDGVHYLDPAFLETKDLDIFGRHSLFQYICTASTIWGQDQLAEWLSRPDKNISEIKKRQQAVEELAHKQEFSMRYETAARSLRSLPYDTAKKIMQEFFQTQNKLIQQPNSAVKFIIYFFPVMTLAFFAAALLNFQQQTALSCFLLFTTFQLILSLLTYQRHSKLLAPIYKMNQTITPYRRLINLLEKETFDSPYLSSLQCELTENNSASSALLELEQIADSVVVRHNLFALILCNSLFLYDFHCARKYMKWKDLYQNSLQNWLTTIGKAEALISLGAISLTKETHSMPQLSNQHHPKLSATNIRHPLIKESLAIGNDVELIHAACIITGSNMSGKTTFMRSIGINLVLAYSGGYCTADSFHVSVMELCTSMRTQDNISEGISTFYAELIRIKKMVELSSQHTPMISLIDEIYKGTNTKDRIYAALETVRTLAKPYAFVIVTTHDFELCDLENDKQIDAENYYFSEYYEQDKIRFDYKIKKGRSSTSNARDLLRMAGILK